MRRGGSETVTQGACPDDERAQAPAARRPPGLAAPGPPEPARLYLALLALNLESMAFSDPHAARSRRAAAVAVATALADRGATPRDLIDLHVEVLAAAKGRSPARAQAVESRCTLLVLEVMGHLAEAYRLRALGLARGDA